MTLVRFHFRISSRVSYTFFKNFTKGVELITMSSSRFYLVSLVGTLCICLCAGSSNLKKCIDTERQALLKLKDGLIHGSSVLSSWKVDDCCKWEGISCNNLTGHVTGLDVVSMDELQGKIDSSICELQHLTFLDLSYNNLEGKIPTCIGSLGQLIELRLAANKLASVIPHSLGNLSNLETLDLGQNHLVANDLDWVSHLSNLQYLDLSTTNLSGAVDWLSSISKVPSLVDLRLYYCRLSQVHQISIPHLNYSFHNLCQLKVLRLSFNKLSGKLSDYIQQLCSVENGIEELDLSHNPLSSEPLPDFSKLSSLNKLSLSSINIVGSLPQSLGHLPYLTELDLSNNQLSGSLSLFNVAKLVSLVRLDLSYNQLNGTLSHTIGQLSSLGSIRHLDLSHNQLYGTLPYTIGQLSSLEELSISSNKLNGVISEANLSNLSYLTYLDVAHNSFSFKLSSSWVPPFQLFELIASSCILGPNFPAWLQHQRRLDVLEISGCGISDSFPKWSWDLFSSLEYLNVSHNKLSGFLPISFSTETTKTNVSTWDLSFNNLSGPLPQFPQLYALFLSKNLFSGSVSSFCATWQWNMAFLDLSNNLLVGALSDCWGHFPSLKILNLASNNLTGIIPKSFGGLQKLETIHLNNNSFSGEIPSMTLCSNLKSIDFGNNNLQGRLPEWVGHNLHNLIVLRLQENKFQGSIPLSLCNLLHLQVLDLSKNNITGKMPQCLSHIVALSKKTFPRETISYDIPDVSFIRAKEVDKFTDKAILTWKGENREYGKNLGLLTTIDLSCNHLTGEIPHSITELVALASLNLSANNLTGFIPNNIVHMTMLESLDLSRNHLHGEIPASLSNLTFLSYMNLSFNKLSGKIPVSTQLQTFDASTYVGNSGLCGPPTQQQCPGDENSPNPQLTGADEDKLITFGFYVSLGFGFIVGFWGVCGTLFFKSSWRHAYFMFFNNIYDWIYVQLVVFTARIKRRFQVPD